MLGDLAFMMLLVLANGVFAAAEIALISVRAGRLRQLARDGSSRAKLVLALRQRPERLLATVQVGVTTISALAAAIGGAHVANALALWVGPRLDEAGLGAYTETVSLGVVVTGISYVSLVVGELVPKSLALRHAESIALILVRPVYVVAQVGRPLVWLFTATSNLLLRPLGDSTSFAESRINAEELRVLIEEAARSGTVDPRSGDIASRALDLSTLTAGEVCVPRHRVACVDKRASASDLVRTFAEQGYHRMPVMDGTPDRIVGYVAANDVLTSWAHKDLVILHDIIRPCHFVPASLKAPALLKQLQEKSQKFAVVVDEHGGMEGIVTLEDLFEELVGEMHAEGESAPELISQVAPGRFLVAGVTPVRDLERAAGLRVPDEVDADTVAGVVLALAREIPPQGARFTAYGATWVVTSRSERRIKQVEVVVLARPSA